MPYTHLDLLQKVVYGDLHTLAHTSIKSEQLHILKRINASLLEYRDFLTVRSNRNDDVHVHQLYVDKLNELKNRVRTAQLEAHTLNHTTLHKQRLEKFHCAPAADDDLNEVDQRTQLFGNAATAKPAELSVDKQILSHNKQITSSLQATRQLLSTSILQSELNIDSLDQQTKDMTHLNEEFMKFSDLLNKSKQIVKFIEKQDKGDKQRIYMSFAVFFLVCLWIIWKRILRVPVKLFLWTFFRTFRIVTWVFSSPSTPSLGFLLVVPSDVSMTTATKLASGSSPLDTIISTTQVIMDAIESVVLDDTVDSMVWSTIDT